MSTSLFPAPQPSEHEINGQTFKFWPISVGAMFRLRGLAKPVAKAVAAFLTNSQNDTASEVVQSGEHRKVSTQAIATDLAKLRYEQRQAAIEQLTEGIFSDPAAKTLAELCIDSMRETFDKKVTRPEAFLESVSAPDFVEMLAGVAKANAKLFDPLKKKAEEITSALRGNAPPSTPPNEPPADSSTSPEMKIVSG